MKRLIRHRVTGGFFHNGHWTQDVQKATAFESTISILEIVSSQRLTDVEAYLLMGEKTSGYDVVLTIGGKAAAPVGIALAK